MKKLSVFLFVMLFFFGITGIANATLWDRGNGLIYDDVLDITWLQDTSYARTSGYIETLPYYISYGQIHWPQAMTWADQLTYGGYDDWRLPSALNSDGSGPDGGYLAGSEMGHMFYNNLGGSSLSFPGSDFIDGYGNNVSFQNLLPEMYWSENDENARWPYFAWGFYFNHGSLSDSNKTAIYGNAWAVRDGDVSVSVPEPATMLLLFSSLIGLAGFRKKFKK